MTVEFKVASCAPPAGGAGAPSRVVLSGEIAGMDVHAHCVGPAAPLAVPRRPGRLGVFLATGGAGSLAVAGAEYAVDEVAVLVPPPDHGEPSRALRPPVQARFASPFSPRPVEHHPR